MMGCCFVVVDPEDFRANISTPDAAVALSARVQLRQPPTVPMVGMVQHGAAWCGSRRSRLWRAPKGGVANVCWRAARLRFSGGGGGGGAVLSIERYPTCWPIIGYYKYVS